jgi:hypothetical protein
LRNTSAGRPERDRIARPRKGVTTMTLSSETIVTREAADELADLAGRLDLSLEQAADLVDTIVQLREELGPPDGREAA